MDGLHRSQRCISSDSNTSGIQKISEVHGLQEGIPIQGPLLWSVHVSAGLHAGHGSGFSNSSQSWHSSPTLSGWLADSGVLPGTGSPGFEDSSSSIQLSGDCRQLGEISACSDSDNLLSGSYFGLNQFQGFSSPETSRQAALNWRRVSILRGAACKILAGVLSSLTQLIPGGRLRMWSFQFVLHRAWDRVDPDALVRWSPEIYQDLLWWLNRERLEHGISLEQVSPQLDLWSDASDVGWGAHLGEQVVSGRWSHEELLSSINHRELLAMFYALQHFLPLVRNTSVAVFADNTTALAYLKNQGGTRSAVLNQTAQDLLRWAELHSVTLLPQFIMGRNNVLADALSRPNQILGSEWALKLSGFSAASEEVASGNRSVCNLSQSLLLTIFFSLPRSQFHRDRCSSPTVGWVAGVCFSTLFSNSCGSEEAPLVLWGPADDHSTLLAPEGVVSGAPGVSGGRTSGSASGPGSFEPASCTSATSGSVKASSSCLETIQRFVKSCDFSRHVAKQTALARCPSSRAGYQAKWSVYRRWCTSEGDSISRPSLPKIADFLFWLRRSKKLSVSAVMGYRSMLSAVFRSVLLEISTSAVLHDLLRSFRVEAPIRSVTPPSWDLLKVLEFLKSPEFEPLHQASLRDLTRKTLFLSALASAKRVSELQALSRTVSFSSSAAVVSCVPEFIAKTESAVRPLPRTFTIQSLSDFAAGLPDEMLLCPVRAILE